MLHRPIHAVTKRFEEFYRLVPVDALPLDDSYSRRTLQLVSICARLDQPFQHAKALLKRIQQSQAQRLAG
jgi:hypothetical protein